MKAKLLFASVCSSFLLASCGGNDTYYDEASPDLASCLVGSWTLENPADKSNQLDETLTFNSDNTYYLERIYATQAKLASWLGSIFLGQDYPEEVYNYGIGLEEGRYEFVDGRLHMIKTRYAQASGDYKQATYNEAAALLASTPETEVPNTYAYQTHCDPAHLDSGVKVKVSESPLTFEETNYSDFVDGVPGQKDTHIIVLNDDSTASTHYTKTFINHREGESGRESNWSGVYDYFTGDEYTTLQLKSCYSGVVDDCLANGYVENRYIDRGTALTGLNGRTYYFR